MQFSVASLEVGNNIKSILEIAQYMKANPSNNRIYNEYMNDITSTCGRI